MSEKRRRQGDGITAEFETGTGGGRNSEGTRWYAKFWKFIFDSRLRVLMITSWGGGDSWQREVLRNRWMELGRTFPSALGWRPI